MARSAQTTLQPSRRPRPNARRAAWQVAEQPPEQAAPRAAIARVRRRGQWRRRLLALCLPFFCPLFCLAPQAAAETPFIIVGSTTSPDNSGLYEDILPRFAAASGIEARIAPVGTGQALAMGRRGDADLVIVHDREAELQFVRDGHGIERRVFMYNDYVLVGPRDDPAQVAGMTSITDALDRIVQTRVKFLSRGDASGTHKKELSLWRQAKRGGPPAPPHYLEAGQGMGATLNMSNELGAYTLVDRSTWLAFGNRGHLALAVENDPRMLNYYSVILTNPAKHPGVRHAHARRFRDWLLSDGLEAIRAFRRYGQQLFFIPRTPPE